MTPTSDEWVEDYVAASHRLVHQHGGQYLARTNTHERLEGNRTNPTPSYHHFMAIAAKLRLIL
ncbi:DUF1330 domain-containing protein [Vibrio stylophorae]|uniref:DUF1330 domain-containing protein n=1 Tax=Vibrio stylophorae TaxID=659351 RepID=UPI001F2EEF63|nr:DUF1330 domain-containing protein [Vibrio stylophorae]